MKIIILILGMFVLLAKKSTIKNLFKTKDEVKETVNKTFTDMKKKSGDSSIYYISVFIAAFVISAIYILFYLFSCIYIGSFLFTMISVFLIAVTIVEFFKALNIASDFSTYKGESIVYRVINLLVDLAYIVFMFYTIYLRW